ncbi:unnamed protein product [Arabidopsis halleri]
MANANGDDWREELYQRIRSMKNMYSPYLKDVYQRVTDILHHEETLPQQQRSENFELLETLKTHLEKITRFLSIPKRSIIPAFKDKVAYYEKLIIEGLNTHRQRRQTIQQGQLPRSQTVQDPSHDNQTNPQMQSMSLQGAGPRAQQSSFPNTQNNVLSSRPGDSAPRQKIFISIPASSLESDQGNALSNANEGDWQEEIFQKIKSMKETYLRDLNDIYQRVVAKLQQEDSLPQQKLRSDQFEKLKRGKTVLEAMLQFLSLSKSNIKPGLKESMDYKEKDIIDFLNMQSLRKTVQKGQLSKAQIQPMQQPLSQTVQDQSHDDQTTVQIQSMSMQGAGSRTQQIKQGVVQSLAIGTPGISASPLLQELTSPDGNIRYPLTSTCGKSSATELPIERLIRAVKSISPQALSSAVSDMISIVSTVEKISGSVPGNDSRASVGEDLVAMNKCRLQERNFMTQEGMVASIKRKRHTTPMPLSVASLGGSVGDSYKQFAGLVTSDMDSSVTCGGKKARTETEHALLEEINEINQRLIDTVVEIINDEDAAYPSEKATSSKECKGTTVRFSFIAVSLSPALEAHLSSTQMAPIRPLRLLVPCSYPNGSPSLVDKLPGETSKEKEDLSSKAMARCNILLKGLSQPMSLKDIAKTWDACARDVICEYAQQFGGGTFSSKYGSWEKFVAAS